MRATKVVLVYVQICPRDLFLDDFVTIQAVWTADYADSADMHCFMLCLCSVWAAAVCPFSARDMNGGRFGPGSNIIQYCTIYLLAILALN